MSLMNRGRRSQSAPKNTKKEEAVAVVAQQPTADVETENMLFATPDVVRMYEDDMETRAAEDAYMAWMGMKTPTFNEWQGAQPQFPN